MNLSLKLRSFIFCSLFVSSLLIVGCTPTNVKEREYVTQQEYVIKRIPKEFLSPVYPTKKEQDWLGNPSLSEKDVGSYIDSLVDVILQLNNKLDKIKQHEDEIVKSLNNASD